MPSSGVQTCALRSEEHTSELQSHDNLVCRLLLEKSMRQDTQPRPCATLRGAGATRFLCGGAGGAALAARGGARPGRPLAHARLARFFFLNAGAPPRLRPFSLPDAGAA